MAELTTSYDLAVEALKTACKSVQKSGGGQKFYVRRGPIRWYDFPFDQHPYAIALHDTDNDLDEKPGFMDASFNLEMMTTLPQTASAADTDENVIYQLRKDAQAIVKALRAAEVSPNHKAVHQVVQPKVALAYDADDAVQGIVLSFDVKYLQQKHA